MIFSNYYKPFRDVPGLIELSAVLIERFPSSLSYNSNNSANTSSEGLGGNELVELNFLSFDLFMAEVETSSH